MASSQQYDSEQLKPQEQTVVVHSKAYPTKILGIKDGNVELVGLIQLGEKVEVNVGLAQVFLLLNKDKNKALVHGCVGEKVSMAEYKHDEHVPPRPEMLWSTHNEGTHLFKHISSARVIIDKGTHTYVNLDVNPSVEVVVNPPSETESQLWKISTFIPV